MVFSDIYVKQECVVRHIISFARILVTLLWCSESFAILSIDNSFYKYDKDKNKISSKTHTIIYIQTPQNSESDYNIQKL